MCLDGEFSVNGEGRGLTGYVPRITLSTGVGVSYLCYSAMQIHNRIKPSTDPSR